VTSNAARSCTCCKELASYNFAHHRGGYTAKNRGCGIQWAGYTSGQQATNYGNQPLRPFEVDKPSRSRILDASTYWTSRCPKPPRVAMFHLQMRSRCFISLVLECAIGYDVIGAPVETTSPMRITRTTLSSGAAS
jgi:hypothetical protein